MMFLASGFWGEFSHIKSVISGCPTWDKFNVKINTFGVNKILKLLLLQKSSDETFFRATRVVEIETAQIESPNKPVQIAKAGKFCLKCIQY